MPRQLQSYSAPIPAAAWKEGSVWVLRYFQTRPGRFHDCIAELKSSWLKQMSILQRDGRVLSYRILRNDFPREGEADLFLLAEYKDMAALDQSVEYQEGLAKEIMGSIRDAQDAEIDRQQVRVAKDEVLMRELIVR